MSFILSSFVSLHSVVVDVSSVSIAHMLACIHFLLALEFLSAIFVSLNVGGDNFDITVSLRSFIG